MVKVQHVVYSEVQGQRTCTLEVVNEAVNVVNNDLLTLGKSSVYIGMSGMVNKLHLLGQIFNLY